MATIYDVAKAVGLSHTAVSAVLNDKPARVSATSRERILEAAKALGYRTNRAAQQLATGKFDTIALCFERAWDGLFLNPFVSQLIAGVGSSASENGLYLLFAPSAPKDKFESTIDSLSSHGVDGAIVVGAVPSAAVPAIDRCTIPLVCIDSYPNYVTASTVDQDNRAGVRTGVEHLISNGHKRMAYMSNAWDCQCLTDRLTGFYEAIQNSGLRVDEQTACTVSPEDVPELIRQLTKAPDRPTAVVSGEEGITEMVLNEVTQLGLRIPGDLSILGYVNPSLGHPLMESISIIHHNPYQLGETAADVLKKIIDGECKEPVSLRYPPEVVLRD